MWPSWTASLPRSLPTIFVWAFHDFVFYKFIFRISPQKSFNSHILTEAQPPFSGILNYHQKEEEDLLSHFFTVWLLVVSLFSFVDWVYFRTGRISYDRVYRWRGWKISPSIRYRWLIRTSVIVFHKSSIGFNGGPSCCCFVTRVIRTSPPWRHRFVVLLLTVDPSRILGSVYRRFHQEFFRSRCSHSKGRKNGIAVTTGT